MAVHTAAIAGDVVKIRTILENSTYEEQRTVLDYVDSKKNNVVHLCAREG